MSRGIYVRTKEYRKKLSLAGLGKKHTEATKKKMSISRMGHSTSNETRRKIGLAHKGRTHSEESRLHMSLAHKGQLPWITGKHHSLETRQKLHIASSLKLGNKASAWKGGLTNKNKLIRNGRKYKNWRMKVFVRDNFTCIECRKIGCYLQAHHIKSFSDYPELRFKVSNGVSLCEDCHKKTNTYLWKNKKGGLNASRKKGI